MSEAKKELARRHFEEVWNNKDLAVTDELMGQDYLVAMLQLGVVQPPSRPPS